MQSLRFLAPINTMSIGIVIQLDWQEVFLLGTNPIGQQNGGRVIDNQEQVQCSTILIDYTANVRDVPVM